MFLGLLCSHAFSQDGFHRLEGQHIQLTTDLKSPQERETLVTSFDAAVEQFKRFWRVGDDAIAGFKVQAFVMRDKDAFRAAGLIPKKLPDFPFGYALTDRIWAVAQQSEYYTRHLLLHEGVHALMFQLFGGAGPSWFMEGTAEMLAVHEGSGRDININRLPVDRDLVPHWGRLTLMGQTREKNTLPALDTVMGYPRDLKSDVESYGWSWAAVMLLSEYEDTHPKLLNAAHEGKDTGLGFNRKLRRALKDWPVLVARWRLMCHDLGYGFDWPREKVDLSIGDKLWDGDLLQRQIAADRGWQSLGVRLAPGMKMSIHPTGRVVLAKEPKPWVSEPPGITFRYHRGRPLGQLLAVIVPNVSPQSKTYPDLQVRAIGRPTTLQITQHCWLLFRVNDYLGELADNGGSYQIKISTAQ